MWFDGDGCDGFKSWTVDPWIGMTEDFFLVALLCEDFNIGGRLDVDGYKGHVKEGLLLEEILLVSLMEDFWTNCMRN